MATLVLSTVGTALGGPIGGAIGALIGQSIDQQLLGPATRGPRLGDLSVQTSSYGTDIPRIYGSMRVAGSVIWATDLVESEQTSGAKGQPDLTYSYSVSLAVALSSRPISAVGRIWADGQLLRGAEGDFKVPTTFRLYDGSESQDMDPLIGSVEGIANTPAYRGLALAVFENLELAAFGNRIPFMTFEVIADAAAPAISTILADASAGMIASEATATIGGYAAYGRSIAAAVQPLVDSFDLPLFDDGTKLRPALQSAPVVIGSKELGNSADGEKASKVQRHQLPARSVPSTLRMTYYDATRDYQTGEARAAASEAGANEVQQQLPAVLSADDAKTLVHEMLARQWARRDTVTLRLPPGRLGLEPGSVIQTDLTPRSWIIDKCTIDGFVVLAELRPAWQLTAALSADAGRIILNNDVVAAPTTFALIDAPSLGGSDTAGPVILVAASSSTPGWGTHPVALAYGGQTFATQTAARKSVLGHALIALPNAEPDLIDQVGSVDVGLVDEQQWLTSCDDDALAEGVNLAVLGDELVQFGTVTPLGQGKFRLSHLLRGRGGTEWAAAAHNVGETFCLLDSNSLRTVSLPIWTRGVVVTVTDGRGSAASLMFGGASTRPLSPCNVSAKVNSSGDLTLAWTRRSRSGFAWIDEVDAPIGESREEYRITVVGMSASLELAAQEPNLVIAASNLAALGPGAATISVQQVGNWAASMPAQLTINLPQE